LVDRSDDRHHLSLDLWGEHRAPTIDPPQFWVHGCGCAGLRDARRIHRATVYTTLCLIDTYRIRFESAIIYGTLVHRLAWSRNARQFRVSRARRRIGLRPVARCRGAPLRRMVIRRMQRSCESLVCDVQVVLPRDLLFVADPRIHSVMGELAASLCVTGCPQGRP
jgi:hypothetical protein